MKSVVEFGNRSPTSACWRRGPLRTCRPSRPRTCPGSPASRPRRRRACGSKKPVSRLNRSRHRHQDDHDRQPAGPSRPMNTPAWVPMTQSSARKMTSRRNVVPRSSPSHTSMHRMAVPGISGMSSCRQSVQLAELLLAGEQVGAPQQEGELGDLRRLELELRDLDPPLGAVRSPAQRPGPPQPDRGATISG